MQAIYSHIRRCELGRNSALELFSRKPSVEVAAIYGRWCKVLHNLELRAERMRNELKGRQTTPEPLEPSL